MSIHIWILAALLAVSCGKNKKKTAFVGEDGVNIPTKEDPPTDVLNDDDQLVDEIEPAPVDDDEPIQATEYKLVTETFSLEINVPQIYYLFVIDNSSSMGKILEKVQEGFVALSKNSDAFAPNALIGVMSTMIGQLEAEGGKLSKLSKYSKEVYKHQKLEPGFLKLVDKASVDTWKSKEIPKDITDQFPLQACKQGWFGPSAVNDQGESCFLAASQISKISVGAEAGITSFRQFLQKNPGIFKADSNVNVIFVSDTHDPGISKIAKEHPEYLTDIVKYDPLLELAQKENQIASLKFHAIAPQEKCAETILAPTYFDLVDNQPASGIKSDVCTLTDYVGQIRAMASAGAKSSHLVALEQPVAELENVSLEGAVWDGAHTLDEENHTILIDGIEPIPGKLISITVEYQVSDHSDSE